MHSNAQSHGSKFGMSWSPANATLVIMLTLFFLMLLILIIVLIAAPAHGQTYQVLHSFTGGADGGRPQSGLTMDAKGNFYGTASSGGSGYGTIFKLTREGSGWLLTPLYLFAGGNDGANPGGRVALAQDKTLFGTTYFGGSYYGGGGWGTAFHLTPSSTVPASALAPWNETVVVRFTGSNGQYPSGDLIFDPSGNIYGTTALGGQLRALGTIYELTPYGGGWTETVLYSPSEYCCPGGGVIFDRSGNLYGVFGESFPSGGGAVYELSPSASGWIEQTLYTFTGGSDGSSPAGGLIMDASGNLYGTTTAGGADQWSGTVFQLMPAHGGGWTFNLLYTFPASGNEGLLGNGSYAALAMDAAGSLYGTTFGGGANRVGSVFKLTPSSGVWTYTSLHDFTGGTDGGGAYSNVVFDSSGNLYGTAEWGGAYGNGVVWEITP